MNQPNSTVAISMFSGAGGLDLGCLAAGVPVIAAIDNDLDSIDTLKLNKPFEESRLFANDISELGRPDMLPIMLNWSQSRLILIGGPPCQPFSKNGYWIQNKNRLIGQDPKNMIGQFIRFIEELNPDGFLLENVESILHPTNRPVVEAMTDDMEHLGYRVSMIRANALDFGVPQKRKRVFFIGISNTKSIAAFGSSPLATQCTTTEGQYESRSVGDVITQFGGLEYFEPKEVAVGGTFYDDLVEVPPGKNYLELTEKRGYPNPKFEYGKRFWNFLLKLHPDLPSWTIPANPGPWVGPFHWDNRRLRVPEIAAIQGFPPQYAFSGTRRSIQRQIGNAVPPPMAESMIKYLVSNL